MWVQAMPFWGRLPRAGSTQRQEQGQPWRSGSCCAFAAPEDGSHHHQPSPAPFQGGDWFQWQTGSVTGAESACSQEGCAPPSVTPTLGYAGAVVFADVLHGGRWFPFPSLAGGGLAGRRLPAHSPKDFDCSCSALFFLFLSPFRTAW